MVLKKIKKKTMSLNDQIRAYLLQNPHLMRSRYADTAKKFGQITSKLELLPEDYEKAILI